MPEGQLETKRKRLRLSTGRLSPEQVAVVDAIRGRKNVLPIAKAGSGKSSTALAAAAAFHLAHQEARTLIITYNTRLKVETRERLASYQMSAFVEAHSYHATAGRFFSIPSGLKADDSLIQAAIEAKLKRPLDFGLIVIDEAQDMNPLYSRFVVSLLEKMSKPPTMLVIGDPFQRIFGFNGATCEYLVRPAAHFGPLLYEGSFTTLHLSICWRISHEMAAWINEHLDPTNLRHTYPAWYEEHGAQVEAWWGKGIRANPARMPAPGSVKVIKGRKTKQAVFEASKMFADFGSDQVALLAYSLKGRDVRAIVNRLGAQPGDDWAVLKGACPGRDVLKGKRLASTVHRMKGLERKGTLVCGMGAWIESYYPLSPIDHFNVWYVACTRATDRMVVNLTGSTYATMLTGEQAAARPELDVSSVDLLLSRVCQFVPFDPILSDTGKLFDARVQASLSKAKHVPIKSYLVDGRADGTVEDVSPFMGRAIMVRMMLEIAGTRPPSPFISKPAAWDEDMIDFLDEFEQMEQASIGWTELMRFAVAEETVLSGFKHLWRQIPETDFCPARTLERCCGNAYELLWAKVLAEGLEAKVGPPSVLAAYVQFHRPVYAHFDFPWLKRQCSGDVRGQADMVFNRRQVIGLECNQMVSGERGLELALCSAILNLKGLTGGDSPAMLLTNVGQWVNVRLTLHPLVPNVPLTFELIVRALRRKLPDVGPVTAANLAEDWATFQTCRSNARSLAAASSATTGQSSPSTSRSGTSSASSFVRAKTAGRPFPTTPSAGDTRTIATRPRKRSSAPAIDRSSHAGP